MRWLLILQLFSCAFWSFSCQKKASESATPPPEDTGNTVDVAVQGPEPILKPSSVGSSSPSIPARPALPSLPGQPASPASPASNTSTPHESGTPVPTHAEPVPHVSSISIQSEGPFIVNQKKKLRAMAWYAESATVREVNALWSLIANGAEATLEADGSILATQPGKVLVRAQYEDTIAEAELSFAYPLLMYKEDQFWVYRLQDQTLRFNSPWDKEPGNGIKRSPDRLPALVLECLNQAKDRFATLQNREEIKNQLGTLIANGATSQLIFMVNVVPVEGRRNDLRRLDRDAYFWHWNTQDQRPSLAMSKFNEGYWVWEVISSPDECVQPDEKEMRRYLDYATTRLGAAL